MCDPFIGALLAGGLSLGSALMAPKPAAPPPIPAPTPQGSRAPGATVHVGAGQEDNTTQTDKVQPAPLLGETRSVGRPVGGLGKSGLAL
jgi:hypothetical protein